MDGTAGFKHSAEFSGLDGVISTPHAFMPMDNISAEEAVRVNATARRIISQVERVIVGKREVIELVIMALLARGHVLIEDIPGVGKTMLAKAIARTVGGSFKRIQFTPDLLPGDVTGITLFSQKAEEFVFNPGPIFANVILADEINRATPKTQSALLESMEESQVTVEGVTRPLAQPFFVMATQNPIEYRGTYPLPEAQMDRFLMRVRLGYPGVAQESEMLARHLEAGSSESGQSEPNQAAALLSSIEPITDVAMLCELQQARMRVHVSPEVRDYIVAVVQSTRSAVEVALGASPRASLALQRVAQAAALLQGREFVTPDDIKHLAPMVLSHRLILHEATAGTTIGSDGSVAVIQRLLEVVPVR